MGMWEVVTLKDSDQRIGIEHHFKIFAGPGAGKTRFLINHIKNVIGQSKRLSKTRKIACITYTNIAVDTIIQRLEDFAEKVEVSTIHSFLYKHIVKPYLFLIKDEFGIPIENIDGHDEIIPSSGLINAWIEETNQKYLRAKDITTKKISEALCDICWQFNAEGQLQLVLRHPYKGNMGKVSIKYASFETYKKLCWERGLLHHDDVLFFSWILLIKNPRIQDIIRAKFPYLFIDEFQDTNPIQTSIIEILANKETIVGVIGDKAQSIYSFQGADVKQFVDFVLPNMTIYTLENNHRSTQEIIDVLNFIREKDLKQSSPDNKRGTKPKVILGSPIEAHKKALEMVGQPVCTLSYTNIGSNEMKSGLMTASGVDLFDHLLYEDSNSKRARQIYTIIKAIEHCRHNHIKDAITLITKVCNSTNEITKEKAALILLKKLVNHYQSFKNKSLTEFYNNDIDGLLVKKNKISSGKIKDFYDGVSYEEVALWVKINEDNSLHRTIHKAKGDEFNNVMILIRGTPSEFNEKKELDFLLSSDIEDESHRVYYVALSRAKKNLFLNIPTIKSEDIKVKLEKMGFEII